MEEIEKDRCREKGRKIERQRDRKEWRKIMRQEGMGKNFKTGKYGER